MPKVFYEEDRVYVNGVFLSKEEINQIHKKLNGEISPEKYDSFESYIVDQPVGFLELRDDGDFEGRGLFLGSGTKYTVAEEEDGTQTLATTDLADAEGYTYPDKRQIDQVVEMLLSGHRKRFIASVEARGACGNLVYKLQNVLFELAANHNKCYDCPEDED